MTRPSRYRVLAAAGLMGVMAAGLSVPAAAHYGRGELAPFAPTSAAASAPWAQSQWHAGASSGVMRVGLVLVDEQSQAPLPDPASLDFPATSSAIRCESDGQRYRECQTPFRGPVALAREVSGTRCIEGENWGWREGRVWVDQGCSAVFIRIGET